MLSGSTLVRAASKLVLRENHVWLRRLNACRVHERIKYRALVGRMGKEESVRRGKRAGMPR